MIASHPKATDYEVQKVLKPSKFDEKSYDRERKAKQRASGRELFIPVPKNVDRRIECLKDSELLLTTYFPQTYFEPFTEDRRDMQRSIRRAAVYGGDQAIAGPRGEGKTTNAVDGAFCLMLNGLSKFPVIIAKNQDAASDELKAMRERIIASDEFVDDFPEIGVPLRAVGPSTANARLLTVGGSFIGMFIGAKHFALPNIPNSLLDHWPEEIKSCANGSVIGAVGIEGRIRGFKFRSMRPTLAIIDDVEDKDSVRNNETIAKIESIIEEDIAGMGASAERISRVYLCTTLNRACNAYKYTDPKQKPSWNGRRYRKMIQPPERMDLVEQYIAMRQSRTKDDPDAREAFRFWRDNKDEIERGCIVSNKHSYSKKIHSDGEPLELSACQSYYNRVADTNLNAVLTEVDNDPPEVEQIQTIDLSHSHIAACLSGLEQKQIPSWAKIVVRGIDMGKVNCSFVDIAFDMDGTGAVIDYGKFLTHGLTTVSTDAAIELAMMNALTSFAVENNDYKIDLAFADSGYYSEAIYEAVRRIGGPYRALKGPDGNYRQPKEQPGKIQCWHECHASLIQDQNRRNLWLFQPNTQYWKNWLQERWMCNPVAEDGQQARGSMTLFNPPGEDIKFHQQFARSQVSERLEHIPIPGGGYKSIWNVIDRANNHWLDAAGYACAAASVLGVRIVQPVTSPSNVAANRVRQAQSKREANQQSGNRFRSRPGGWIKGARKK